MLRISTLIFVAVALLINSCSSADKQPPNIILIMSDDMGYSDIGCYGSEIKTPVLDDLAENGVRFSQFYNTARCCPTRASILTGLYPAQTGMGMMTSDQGLPGYRGEIGKQCMTIAEVLKPAGYNTYMSGKWHVARNLKDIDSLKYNWPIQRGFDKFYGTIIGAGSLWDPWTLCRNNTLITPENDPEYKPDQKWHYTDAISDNAVKYIETHAKENSKKPFFLYVAYTAAHWPLHAPKDEIALHKGEYDKGYADVREKRYKKLIELGLIDEQWKLSEPVAMWDTMEHQAWHARNMEVYAAMITQMDKGIGRIVNSLKKNEMLHNTLVLFLQDNGGCAETLGWGLRGREYNELSDKPVYEPMGPNDLQNEMFPIQNREGYPVAMMNVEVMAGSDQTYHAYGPTWANVSNTPFRKFKSWVHEGGISTPLIAHWPDKIKDHGAIRRQPGHLIDIMATIVDVSGAEYPENYNGHAILPLEGKSLTGVFENDESIERDAIYFEHGGNRAIRKGKWKLVSRSPSKNWRYNKIDELSIDMWALYDMEKDRSETNDLSSEHPEKVKELAAQWQKWAVRTNTVPKP